MSLSTIRPTDLQGEDAAKLNACNSRSPLRYFALVLGVSVPFWLLGAATDLQLMPGLSVSALMAFCPMAVALMLAHREQSPRGALGLLKRSFDFRRITAKRWYAPVLMLMPVVSLAVYGLMRWMHLPMPSMQSIETIAALPAFLMFLAFFVAALGEELGWSGYALGPLQSRWTALQAGLILGVVSVLWHLVPLLLVHRSPTWIAWWCLYAGAARILIVWLYNNTGNSVFAVALFHATLNLTYMLFPVYGSYFDMRLGGLVMAFVAAMVAAIWGSKTLTRFSVPVGG